MATCPLFTVLFLTLGSTASSRATLPYPHTLSSMRAELCLSYLLEPVAARCQAPSAGRTEGLKGACPLAWIQHREVPSVPPGPSQVLPGRGLPTLPLPGQMMASSRVTRLARSSS